METSELKNIFIILVDITGYTRFIRYHRISLLHAEKIIAELMESILAKVEVPVIAHEILGDAISLFAVDENTPGQADKIYEQLHKYFMAFREREADLISSCSLCQCEACKQVGKLRLKAILHHGQVAFTIVHNIQKISGEDVILSHRLLKNSLASKEYILMTSQFTSLCDHLDKTNLVSHSETYQDIGRVDLYVKDFDEMEVRSAELTFIPRLFGFLMIEGYMIKRIFTKDKKKYRNLEEKKIEI